MSTLYLLFESSSGYGLFERVKAEVIEVSAVQQDINDLKKFSELVKLKCQLHHHRTPAALCMHSLPAVPPTRHRSMLTRL